MSHVSWKRTEVTKFSIIENFLRMRYNERKMTHISLKRTEVTRFSIIDNFLRMRYKKGEEAFCMN